jgi:predicted RNA-binding protein with PUA-like domain
MNYWILQSNPKKFLLGRDDFLLRREGELDWWGIKSDGYINKVKEKNTVFIWHSIDNRNPKFPKPRGIYARGVVLSVWPNHSPEVKNKIKELKERERSAFRDPSEANKQEAKPDILLQYCKSYKKPLTYDDLLRAGLGDIRIVNFSKLEICSLSESNARKILRLLEDNGEC